MSIDYDTYLARETEKHMREPLWYSNCCSAEMEHDDVICPSCKEYCDIVSEDDFNEGQLEDIADQKMEQRRDEQR